MPSSKIQTGLRLSEELYDKAKTIADKEKRSLNNLVEYALILYVVDYESKHGEISLSE